jgi:putative membrane protein insertion efficiency factor
MKKILLWLISFYQKYISKLKKPCCRYYPSCSEYSKRAIEKFGAVKGFYLSVKRILRCNPFFKGGIDHVPEEFSFFKSQK